MSNETEPPKEQLALPVALPPGVDRLSDLGTLLTLQEVAERLQVSVKTVRRMVTAGKFLGSHQVPMTSGKGLQWVVPYSEVVKAENTPKPQATIATNKATEELSELRQQVVQLQARLDVQEALATERARQLEQLHTSFRALMPGEIERKKRRWRKQ
jgi:excisionase family DNA binding protein